jgi:DNA-binding NarL/FixJ family response regulator
MTPSSEVRPRIDKRKVLIVDDHPIVRKGLMQLIAHEPDIEVCGEAENVADGLELVRTLRPDLVVVDMSLKESHGIELIGQVRASYPEVKMLVWSMFDETVFAERALRAGAMGYINKQQSIENMVDAIRQVLDGEVYLSSQMTNRFLRRVGGRESLEEDPIRRLTDRELQIFEMIGQGMTTQRIARKLDISPKTVASHREKIKTKLDLNSAAELAQRAVQWVLENG